MEPSSLPLAVLTRPLRRKIFQRQSITDRIGGATRIFDAARSDLDAAALCWFRFHCSEAPSAIMIAHSISLLTVFALCPSTVITTAFFRLLVFFSWKYYAGAAFISVLIVIHGQ
jgi:hypothetical protein